MWTLAIVLITAAALLAGCKKSGVVEEQQDVPQPSQADIPVPPGMPPAGVDPGAPAPQRNVDAADVATRWKGVEITVAEKEEGGSAVTVELTLDGEAEVEGTPLKIKLLGFVPDFAMGADTITTKSLDDNNPAAKIEISEGETVLFTGWSFRDFHGMHSFDDPLYSVTLTRAVPME
jgi:hypothetical protein